MRVLGSAVVEEPVKLLGREMTIAAKCGGSGGQWACVNHDVALQNNMDKDVHIEEGVHVLAWLCYEHGPEVP